MFDRTYVQGGPSRVSVTKTVTENRAPTDQSVQLLRELEEKAHDEVVQAYVSRSNVVEGAVVEVRNDPYSPDTELHIGFRLNGKWNRVVLQKPDHFRFDPASCFRLLAERLAVAIRDQLLKDLDRHV